MVPGLLRLRDRFDALLLDLDGTLLSRGGHIRPRTVRAIRALAHHGFQVLICTGRSIAGTLPAYQAIDLGGPIIAYNGHWIGVPGEDPWHILRIPDQTVTCVHAAEQHAAFAFRYRDEQKYTLRSAHPEHEQVLNWFENTVPLEDPAHLPTDQLMRVSMFLEGTESVDAAWSAMAPSSQAILHREVFPLSLFPNYEGSTLQMLELQAKSRGKAEAFVYLQEVHGIPAARTIAIGDHLNDLTMLETAGFAIIPANATAEVRPLADLVIGHHDHDAVAQWIEAGAPIDPQVWLVP